MPLTTGTYWKKLIVPLTSMVTAFAMSHGAQAADPDNGYQLYHNVKIKRTIRGVRYTDANCETCHNVKFLQREDRIVTTYAKLEAYVEGCNTTFNVMWFPEDVADVSAYMNREFYKFDE